MNTKDFEAQAQAVCDELEGRSDHDVPTIAAALSAAYTAGTKEKRCTNFCPPTWTAHWRIWHRGHGCDLDDGVKP